MVKRWFSNRLGCCTFQCYSLTEMHELPLFKPVAVAMLILANAYFVAAEFALVSIRETRVEQLLAARVPGRGRCGACSTTSTTCCPPCSLG